MAHLTVGLDIGTSTTKAIALEETQIVAMQSVGTKGDVNAAQHVVERVIQAAGRKSEDVRRVLVAGGGARHIDDTLLGIPVIRVAEMRAIGLGGLALSGKPHALVVSMGTGTALVRATDHGGVIEHVGGTGVGGGTIEGLARRMLGVEAFEVLETMARRGEASRVNLTVAEVVGGPVGILSGDATASNFQKFDADSSGDDVAAAILGMVAEVIGVLTSLAAKAYHLEEDVVLVGRLTQSELIVERVRAVTDVFQIGTCVPSHGEYCVALGAATASL